MSLYDADGNIRVTEADSNSRGLYAPDGSYYVNIDSGNKGLYGPNGCLNVENWGGIYSVYNPDGGRYAIMNGSTGILLAANVLNTQTGVVTLPDVTADSSTIKADASNVTADGKQT